MLPTRLEAIKICFRENLEPGDTPGYLQCHQECVYLTAMKGKNHLKNVLSLHSRGGRYWEISMVQNKFIMFVYNSFNVFSWNEFSKI